jgi:prolyl-tRNA synthetase
VANEAVLTPQGKDFPQWYQDVVARAELAENGPARGSMVIRPWAWATWELMQADMDRRIKATGVQNAYFPLFIPMSFLEKEQQHVEGFSPELAVVTHGGGEELAEPLVVRPTSETVINHLFAKWIQSHRDLPLLLNQWANVVRWELRPRLFLRTTEFLWQEGHTAHATYEEAQAETMLALEVYRAFMEETLACAVVTGEKSAAERFAGADRTYTCEGLMRDGKALQMGTSHNLGHNFARAFDIQYLSAEGRREYVATTSWGSSTRMLGGVIMTHGDDYGLRLPPAIAPHQVVLIPLAEGEVARMVDKLAGELRGDGVRAHVDTRFHLSFGRRSVDWELKGVPVRVEVGPRDLANGEVTIVRRDRQEKRAVAVGSAAAECMAVLVAVQGDLFDEAQARLASRTVSVGGVDEAAEAVDGGGFAVVPWAAVGEEGETRLAAGGLSVRCLRRADGSLADSDTEDGLMAVVAKAYCRARAAWPGGSPSRRDRTWHGSSNLAHKSLIKRKNCAKFMKLCQVHWHLSATEGLGGILLGAAQGGGSGVGRSCIAQGAHAFVLPPEGRRKGGRRWVDQPTPFAGWSNRLSPLPGSSCGTSRSPVTPCGSWWTARAGSISTPSPLSPDRSSRRSLTSTRT